MKIEKRGNSYRIQSMYKGKRYSVTFDHKPSQKEITLALAAKYEENEEKRQAGSMKDYCLKYIESRRKKGISTTTLKAYGSISRNLPEWFADMPFYDVKAKDFQRLVDECAIEHSPKTVSNIKGLCTAVFKAYRPSFSFNVEMPKKVKKFSYNPTTADVMAVLNYAKGSEFSVFLQLATLNLRRGEIAALTLDDLSDTNILTINKDFVYGENNVWQVKDVPKTSASNRRILIPAPLADEIRRQGYFYKYTPGAALKYVHRVQDKLGIPRFSLHRLRHYAAAYLNKMGFTRDQILEYCGWEKGSNVMEKVYSYNLDPEESQKDIASAFNNLF